MKKLLVVPLALLAFTGSAEARVSVSAYDAQGLTAALALNSVADDYATGIHGTQGFCKPFKRGRARCGQTMTATLFDGTPIRCWAQIVVSTRWWHYPPERFGCPIEWYPG